MATIKGQHLRLIVNEKCVAAAQTCTVHLSVQMENSSSKDDTGSWQQQIPVGLTWDASTDALVIDGVYESGSGKCTQQVQVGGPNPAYIYTTAITVAPGRGVSVSGAGENSLVLRLVSGSNYTVISEGGKYVNTGTTDATVYIGCLANNTTLTYAVYDGSGLQLEDVFALKGTKVDVQFGTTTGDMNRESDELLLEGQAIVSDISVTAANRANSTYTVQLAGTGELELVNNE